MKVGILVGLILVLLLGLPQSSTVSAKESVGDRWILVETIAPPEGKELVFYSSTQESDLGSFDKVTCPQKTGPVIMLVK